MFKVKFATEKGVETDWGVILTIDGDILVTVQTKDICELEHNDKDVLSLNFKDVSSCNCKENTLLAAIKPKEMVRLVSENRTPLL